jgi:3-oxoacyl-(acyl-carrier-protein) synthase
MRPIFITSLASISALGTSPEEVWKSFQSGNAFFSEKNIGNKVLVSELSPEGKTEIENLRQSNPFYKNLDESVLFAIYASRKALESSGWDDNDFGINIGSSRGATGLFEKHHQSFLKKGTAETLASPTTTLGNISSWVAQDLQSNGPAISHSITCSTALHAFLNGIAWLRSGMADKFLVGGSEAPLTEFTIAQMKALKLYAQENKTFPCESLKLDKKANSMILGEAAGTACLETESKNPLAKITGYGYATEKITHNISISADAECFQKSMKMALESANLKNVDAVVMHAPGTAKGDLAELKAIEKTFSQIPALTTNKWQIGHTFGASGMMSVEMGLLMLQHQKFIENPFYKNENTLKKINSVMVNAVGFGGNAVSLVLASPD